MFVDIDNTAMVLIGILGAAVLIALATILLAELVDGPVAKLVAGLINTAKRLFNLLST